MNKLFIPIATIVCALSSCEAPPESYFGRAVLNLNMAHGFAGKGMEGQLRQPSAKLADDDSKKVVQMTRKEVVDNKIMFIDDSYGKVKLLKENDDNRAMIQASKAVYEYILPVYKKEYQDLAKLYDDAAPQAEIDALSQKIIDTYADGYQSRMDALVAAAKPYAKKHELKVKWDVGR